MAAQSEPHICFDRIIPRAIDPAGAKVKQMAKNRLAAMVQKYPTKLSDLPHLSADHPVIRAYLAVNNYSKWEDGHSLTCKFLDGDPERQKKVIANAKLWEGYANVKIDFVADGDAEVRISFQADPGSWSAVGKDCLNEAYFPKDKPTMNFGWLRSDTSDLEYERVVVHEFGHALGCEHEAESPAANLQWDVAAVYKAFSGPPNNWSKDEIDQNILEKYGPKGISFTVFDIKSIMLYQFDASLFLNHVGTPQNYELSDLDKSMIAKMYPRNP